MIIAANAINASQMAGASQALTNLVSAGTSGTSGTEISSSENAVPFSNLIREAVASEQKLESQASDAAEGLMRGSGVDVHQVMIATQKADVAFELALSVRNKAVAAYQQMMGMQF
jgi:flagellar hook-basal body complex protein FliE